MKMRTVLKQPPPNFFAPYPAAMPRSSLLIDHVEEVVSNAGRKCRERTGALNGVRASKR
jgi:hypothetical protein